MFLKIDISLSLSILLNILTGNTCIYQSNIKASNYGYQFEAVYYSGQILSTTMINGLNQLKLCSILCNQNIVCRIFDINAIVLNQCRLFQGDMYIHGNIISSSMNNAKVGFVQYSVELYSNYGQSCSINSPQNRYLICGTSFTWECPPSTYWNSSISMCSAQSPLIGSDCQQNLNMCREDLHYTCLQFNQCGPLSLLIGTTIVDSTTVIANSATVGIYYPDGVFVNQTTDNAIIVTNSGAHQVIGFYDSISSVNNVSLIAQNWTGGHSLFTPFGVAVHPNEKSNLYVADYDRCCVFKIFNMQVISPLPAVVAGIYGACGAGTGHLHGPAQIAVDSNGNIYIADTNNHRIIRWPPNSTTGSVIAGLGTAGSDSFSLNTPKGLLLDENNSYIYVGDCNNNRIQRFSLIGGSPNNGTTVAGGNGLGATNTQLNSPMGLYISKKRNVMYIADCVNHRIQRWKIGEQSAVTIAGDLNGIAGSTATMLQYPYNVAVNDEETFLYVSDSSNYRIQRFQLV